MQDPCKIKSVCATEKISPFTDKNPRGPLYQTRISLSTSYNHESSVLRRQNVRPTSQMVALHSTTVGTTWSTFCVPTNLDNLFPQPSGVLAHVLNTSLQALNCHWCICQCGRRQHMSFCYLACIIVLMPVDTILYSLDNSRRIQLQYYITLSCEDVPTSSVLIVSQLTNTLNCCVCLSADCAKWSPETRTSRWRLFLFHCNNYVNKTIEHHYVNVS